LLTPRQLSSGAPRNTGISGSKDKYLALFNTSPAPASGGRRGGSAANAATNAPAADATQTRSVSVSLVDLGFTGNAKVRDLWNHKDLGSVSGQFTAVINSHGAGLYRLTPAN
jgi:hypothetical protein